MTVLLSFLFVVLLHLGVSVLVLVLVTKLMPVTVAVSSDVDNAIINAKHNTHLNHKQQHRTQKQTDFIVNITFFPAYSAIALQYYVHPPRPSISPPLLSLLPLRIHSQTLHLRLVLLYFYNSQVSPKIVEHEEKQPRFTALFVQLGCASFELIFTRLFA